MAWNEGLDPESVTYKIAAAAERRVRVIAGPGTGKSFAMKRRVARHLEAGVSSCKILAVTFTRVAAEDLHRELQKLGVPGCEDLEGQTLHSLAMRILSRAHVFQAVGRTPRPLNKFELNAMHADLCGAHGGKKTTKKLVKAYEAAWAQSQGDEPGFAKNNEEKAFHKALLEWLRFHQGMLIGEVIPYFVRYMKENPLADEHSEFEHLLVDEYQDLNKAEQTAIGYLGAKAGVCIVGDDDQSIYGFKNAHPDGIREWKDAHPGCADLEMAACHRCPTRVVAMANALIAHNTNRITRELNPIAEKGEGEVVITQLKTIKAEAEWIARKISNLHRAGVHPSEIIVLVQRSHAAAEILKALKNVEVPAKSYYDESQLEQEAAQTRFALFKLLLNREDRVALRYLIGAGIGDFRAGPYGRLRAHCEQTGDSPWVALEKLVAGDLAISHMGSLSEAFTRIKAAVEKLGDAVEDLRTFTDELLPEAESDVSELRQLALSVVEECSTPKELFTAMMKEITQPDIPPTVEEVRVMSLHKSKGLSSPYVFIAGCVQGLLPRLSAPEVPKTQADAELEEARRLFFVGITRVKASPEKARPGSLFLTYPKEMDAGKAKGANVAFNKVVWGKAYLLPSMFLNELGPAAPKPVSA